MDGAVLELIPDCGKQDCPSLAEQPLREVRELRQETAELRQQLVDVRRENLELRQQVEIEVRAFRRRIRRRRYQRTCHCPNCPRTLTAPPPPKLIPKGLLGSQSGWRF